LLALAAAGAAGWYLLAPGRAASGEETLVLHGNVDIREVKLGFRVAGRIAEMRVEEGDRVETGDVLANLDPVPLRQEVALAEAELAGARAALAKMEAGSRPEEIAQAEALVAEREASLVNARADFKRQSQLVERGVASASAYDDAQARVTEVEAALASSRQALELARAGFREEDIASARASLRAAEAQLAQTMTRLEDATLRAPSAGVILTRIEEEGAIVGVGEPVYTLSLASPVWVRAYIPEPELGRVRPGQPAEVTNDSAPGRVYHGQVGFVSPVAEFTPKTVETPELRTDLVYRLRVVVTDADERLRQGMPVTVRLQAGSGGSS
jgi:HlyD family secretion protein